MKETAFQLLSGAHILIVEDNVVDQKLISAMLEKFSCICDIANSGVVAVEKIKKMTYNAILMDYHSTFVNGFQTLHLIRETETKTPIIVLIAHSLNNAKKECLDSGMDDFVGKPINPSELYSILTKYISPESICKGEYPRDQIKSDESRQGIENNEDGLNYEVLDKLHLLLGKQAFKGLIDAYISRAALHIQSARQHIELGDMGQLHFVAHTLKGSSANLGVNILATLCAILEDKVLQTKPAAELYQQLDILEKQFSKIQKLLVKNLIKRAS